MKGDERTRKTMDGAAARAFRNRSRIAFSDSPTYLLKIWRAKRIS